MCAHREFPGELLDLAIIAIAAPWQGGEVGGRGQKLQGSGRG